MHKQCRALQKELEGLRKELTLVTRKKDLFYGAFDRMSTKHATVKAKYRRFKAETGFAFHLLRPRLAPISEEQYKIEGFFDNQAEEEHFFERATKAARRAFIFPNAIPAAPVPIALSLPEDTADEAEEPEPEEPAETDDEDVKRDNVIHFIDDDEDDVIYVEYVD
jgi:hypothetical protein